MDRLINENAVLSAIGEWIAHNEHTYTNATEYLRNRIKAIKTAEQEPTAKENLVVGDCISRQAVLDLINADWKYEGLETEINTLPSIQPKPKTGHWIPKYIVDDCNGVVTWYECSECGRSIDETITEEFMLKNYPYCHCGAKMLPTDSDTE